MSPVSVKVRALLTGALACLLASAAIGAAAGETAGLPELAQLLGKVEADPSVDISTALQPHLVHFRDIDARRQREFAVAKGRQLSSKAADRLAQARTAYAAGHGRLLSLLQQIANTAPTAGATSETAPTIPPPDRSALAHEAAEIVRKLQNASGGVPISQSLSVGSPSLAPPALNQSLGGSQSADTIGPVPQSIQTAAGALADPIAIYESVLNSIKPDFYYGVMKGPVQALAEGSANDADTAAVLMFMLRAKGIPARYVRGTIEVPAATLTQITGTGRIEQAVRVLERAGIPHEIVLGGSGVSSVKMERVWVEAYMPSTNYRGALLDAQGKFWIPLDASFKPLSLVKGIDAAHDLGFDARQTIDDYIAAPQTQTALQYMRARVGAAAANSGGTYDGVLSQRQLIPESLGILPNSLPYKVLSVTETSYNLPDPLRHTIRIRAEAISGPMIDTTLNIADVLGRRLTLSYVPFSQEDADLAASYGGLVNAPPYLIDVKAVVKSGGITIAAGSGPIGLGVRYTLHLELGSPGGTQIVEQQVTAGNLTVIGLGGRAITEQEADQSEAAAILSRLAWRYLDKWNASDEELANLTHVVPVRPTVSVCLVMSAIDVQYAGGDPQYPLTFDWKGIAIDAHHRASAPAGMFSNDAERSFLLLSGLEGSVLEERLFEDELGIDSVSTTRVLGMAQAQGRTVFTLDGSNVEQVLPTLPFDPQVLGEVRDSALRGFQVTIPAGTITELAWTGVGYRILDDRTGEATYQLQGGYAGGMTAPSVSVFPASVGGILKGNGEVVVPSLENPRVAHIKGFPADDFQFGTVNHPLAKPFRVLVTDAAGAAVKGASITFTTTGGGSFSDPATGAAGTSELTILSNSDGIATVTLSPGTLTSLIPRYLLTDGDEFSTQVGLNQATASSGTVVQDQPFTAVALPDYRVAKGSPSTPATWQVALTVQSSPAPWAANLTVADRTAVLVQDQYGNPISNKPITFAYRGVGLDDVSIDYPGYSLMRDATTTPGRLLKTADFNSCMETFGSVRYGTAAVPECPGQVPALTVNSAVNGAFAYPVLGDSPFSHYDFNVGTPENMQVVQYHTMGPLCASLDKSRCGEANATFRPTTMALMGQRWLWGLGRGPLSEAYKVGDKADMTFWTDVLWEEATLVPVPNRPGHCTAVGSNRWHRDPLSGSVIKLTPDTADIGVAPATAEELPSHGLYRSQMTTSLTPKLNNVRYDASATPSVIPYLLDSAGHVAEVDPKALLVDPNTCAATDPNVPDGVKRAVNHNQVWTWKGNFQLWGIKPTITEVSTVQLDGTTLQDAVLLTSQGVVELPADVRLDILPAEFKALLQPTDVRFDMLDGNSQPVISGHDPSRVVIPEKMPLPAGTYQAQVSVLGASFHGNDIVSDPHYVQVSRCRAFKAIAPPDPFDVSILNWTMHVSISDYEGLRLDRVMLGQRQLADSMSLPYLRLKDSTISDSAGTRCQLKPDAFGVCDQAASPAARSQLVGFHSTSNDAAFAIQATYRIDQIDGTFDSGLPDAPETCVLVTQKYEFKKETSGWLVPPIFPLLPFEGFLPGTGTVDPSGDPCEATGRFPCARFIPSVSYEFKSSRAKFGWLQAAQRLAFDVKEPLANQPPTGLGSNAAVILHDCNVLGIGESPGNGCLSVVTELDNENPLSTESIIRVVENGHEKSFVDAKGIARISMDNLHQSSMPVVDEPFIDAGCPECAHMHWRWASFLAYPFFNVHPLFNNNGGVPFVPINSPQHVDVGLAHVSAGEGNPRKFEDLFDGESILPGSGSPSFWYAGQSTQLTDSFLTHGGFFSSQGIIPYVHILKSTVSTSDVVVEFTINDPQGEDVSWEATAEQDGQAVSGSFSDDTGVIDDSGTKVVIRYTPTATSPLQVTVRIRAINVRTRFTADTIASAPVP